MTDEGDWQGLLVGFLTLFQHPDPTAEQRRVHGIHVSSI